MFKNKKKNAKFANFSNGKRRCHLNSKRVVFWGLRPKVTLIFSVTQNPEKFEKNYSAWVQSTYIFFCILVWPFKVFFIFKKVIFRKSAPTETCARAGVELAVVAGVERAALLCFPQGRNVCRRYG